MTSTLEPKRKIVGDDANSGVRITAKVAAATELPIRWFERTDGTFVLQFCTEYGWVEVPLIERP